MVACSPPTPSRCSGSPLRHVGGWTGKWFDGSTTANGTNRSSMRFGFLPNSTRAATSGHSTVAPPLPFATSCAATRAGTTVIPPCSFHPPGRRSPARSSHSSVTSPRVLDRVEMLASLDDPSGWQRALHLLDLVIFEGGPEIDRARRPQSGSARQTSTIRTVLRSPERPQVGSHHRTTVAPRPGADQGIRPLNPPGDGDRLTNAAPDAARRRSLPSSTNLEAAMTHDTNRSGTINVHRRAAVLIVAALAASTFGLTSCGVVNAAKNAVHTVEGNKSTIDAFTSKVQSGESSTFEATYMTTGSSPATVVYAVQPPNKVSFTITPSPAHRAVDAATDLVVNQSGEYSCTPPSGSTRPGHVRCSILGVPQPRTRSSTSTRLPTGSRS